MLKHFFTHHEGEELESMEFGMRMIKAHRSVFNRQISESFWTPKVNTIAVLSPDLQQKLKKRTPKRWRRRKERKRKRKESWKGGSER